MKAKIILAVALLLGAAATKADAQTINAKARHERQRINGGVRNGELTGPETYRLGREQRNIRGDVYRSRRDGHFSPRERKHIRHEQRKHSRHIFRAKHNRHHRHF
jgi:hypothetical protein